MLRRCFSFIYFLIAIKTFFKLLCHWFYHTFYKLNFLFCNLYLAYNCCSISSVDVLSFRFDFAKDKFILISSYKQITDRTSLFFFYPKLHLPTFLNWIYFKIIYHCRYVNLKPFFKHFVISFLRPFFFIGVPRF